MKVVIQHEERGASAIAESTAGDFVAVTPKGTEHALIALGMLLGGASAAVVDSLMEIIEIEEREIKEDMT